MASDPKPPTERTPPRSGERFDGGTDGDEDAGAGFGEGDDAKRVRGEPIAPDAPDK